MEERIIDRDKRIKLKRTEEGVDAVEDDGLDTPEEELEEEVLFDLPDGEEYDDELVGLTPSQLKAKQEARRRAEEKAREEYEKLFSQGEFLLAKGKYAEAEPLFAQASIYEHDDGRAKRKLWLARTQNLKSAEFFYEEGVAQEFAWSDEDIKKEVLSAMGEELRATRDAYREEAEPLRERYTAKKDERGEAFRANKKYYALRFLIVLGVIALFGIACAVSGTYIMRTQDSLPLILTIAFSAAAFLTVFVLVYFARKLFVAWRLVRDNEKPASTEDGARLDYLDTRIHCLNLVLGE